MRAFPRVLFEGLFGNNNPTGLMGGLNNISKVGGLAPFAYFNTVQKAHEIAGYIETGDYGRATAGVAEMANGLRIGVNGVSSLVGAINSPAGKWISSHLGGTAGQKFGVGANVVAGVGRAYSNYDRYQKELACADTPREEDIASVNHFEAQLGNVLDTGNDLVPMLGRGGKDKPINWATWFASKAMDHWAQDKLEGTAYVPLSIGADHARNLTPLAAAVGLTPTVEHYDLSTARSDDERIVMEESNSVDKAAGISAGVTDVTVTGLEVGLATYYGRKPEIVYGVLQADHIARQGMNIWTGGAWQSPDERAAAVEAAGLDPALDPHRVEYEQEDFLNRSAASAMSDANIARLKAKAYAGGATADELRYLEIVEEYENADIDSSTNGRGSNTGIFSPHGMWESMKLTNPVFSGLDALPEGAGYTIGWVQGGGIGNTVDAVGDFATDVGEGAVDFVSDVGKAGKDFVGHLNPLSWG